MASNNGGRPGWAARKAAANFIRELLFQHRHRKACRELQRDVERRANSYEVRRFREHRIAALKGTRREHLSKQGAN